MIRNIKLLENNQKHEIWWNLLKEISIFFSKQGLIDSENFQKISKYLGISKYELFFEKTGSDDLFNSFVNAVMSKSACFQNEWILNSLRRVTFENNYCSLFLKNANDYLFQLLEKASKLLKKLSQEYKDLVQVGRTHGIHAEPVSFGYRFALCYLDLERNIESIKQIRRDIEIAWVGLASSENEKITLQLQKHIADTFSLFIKKEHFLELPYNKYGIYLSYISSVTLDIYKLFCDFHFFVSEEVSEIVSNKFKDSFITVNGCHKSISNSVDSYSNCLEQNFEIPIFGIFSKWSLVEVAVNDFVCLMETFVSTLESIFPNEASLEKNLSMSQSRIFSQAAMARIIKLGNLNRQQVLTDMKYISATSANQNKDFKNVLMENSKYKNFFASKGGDLIFAYQEYLKNIDILQLRIFQPEKLNIEGHVGILDLFKKLDLLVNKLNFEYQKEISPIVLIAFENESMVFLGLLIEKLRFPVTLVVFSNFQYNLEIASLKFDLDLLVSKRILIIDFGLCDDFDLEGFCKKLTEIIFIKELKKCTSFLLH